MLKFAFLFCVYSIIGWGIEVVFFFIKTGKLQKRGILNGTYCPLYGFSMSVSTALLTKANSIFIEFIICAVICVIFEFITGIVFDIMLHHKMWDYAGIRGNIGGYICPTFAVIWGILGVIAIRIINPILLKTDFIIMTVATVGICVVMVTDLYVNILETKKYPDA